MKVAFKVIFVIIFSIILLGILTLTYLFISVKDFKLNENKLKTVVKKIEYYDNCNNLIYKEVFGGKNEYISLDKLNKHTIDAFIAIEDRKFYSHNGIDYKRIIGATINNVKSMKFKEGASTISQQLIKNTHLNSEKTLKRKVAEFKITLELEKKYTKEQILEKYLNTIYFGNNAYGINEASMLYFNKTADKLDLNESAVLAGLIKAPNVYSPFISYEKSMSRKNIVLKAMLDCSFITNSDYLSNKNKDVTVIKSKSNNFYDDYISAVKVELSDKITENPYESTNVKVYTYFDSSVQNNLYDTKVDEIDSLDKIKIVINNKNNGVIAFYGKNSKLKRCPASTVKPWLIYAPMINDKYITESSVIEDSKVNFSGYSPKNYKNKYYGNVTVKDAIINSLNIPPVKLLDGFQIKNVNKYTSKMGVIIKNEGLSSALGSIENGMTLKEICDAYSVFNNDGDYIKSSFIKSITVNGKSVYNENKGRINVFDKSTSYIITDALIEAKNKGTSKKLKDFNFGLAAKTGTNGDNTSNLDAYSISYTTNHIIGVWIGLENGETMPNNITGGGYPTIFNREIVKFLYKDNSPQNFTIPSNVVKVKLDKNLLIKNKENVVCDNGESFYYILGTEPKEKIKSSNFKLNFTDISLKNNIVTIKNSSENCESFKVIRYFKGNNKVIYDSKYTNIVTDKLDKFGIYEYKIIFKDFSDNEIPITLKSINYTKNSLEIINDDWWDL